MTFDGKSGVLAVFSNMFHGKTAVRSKVSYARALVSRFMLRESATHDEKQTSPSSQGGAGACSARPSLDKLSYQRIGSLLCRFMGRRRKAHVQIATFAALKPQDIHSTPH